jgi:molybdate transport system substrate-binding protein
MRRTLLLVAVVAVTSLVGCGGSSTGGGGGEQEGGDRLRVFAATSLTDAFGELAKTFEEDNPGVEVRLNLESSTTLLAQIQQGAPADVYGSSAEEEMDKAVKDGLVAGEPKIFAKNREVIMVPKENPANIRSLRDLARPGVKLVLTEEGVPSTDYAIEILGKANARYRSGFKEDVLSNVVSQEANVRAAVDRVAHGDYDGTFSYASDYTPDIRERVKVIEIPEDLNIVATYPVAALKDAESPELAREWVDLVVSAEGQRVLKKWGFEPAAS